MSFDVRPAIPPTPMGYRVDRALPIVSAAVEVRGAHRVAPHRHPRAQLIYSIHGVLRVISAQGAWVVPTSQAVWIPSGVEHEVVAAASLSIRTLFVDGTRAGDLPPNGCVVNVSPLLRELILRAMEIGNEYPSTGPERRLMEVVLDELRRLEPAPLHLPLARDARVRKVMEALTLDPADERGMKELAPFAGAGVRTLARLFVQETGMTFAQWRKQMRLLEAIERLGRGDPVTRVAFELGYRSPSSFITMFRQALGDPPRRYFKNRGSLESQA